MKKWTIDDSKELYNINGWDTSYFGVNDKGDVYVTPCKDNTEIDLRDVMDELALRDVTPPVLLRFPDILDNRIEKTSSCFKKAADEYGYKAENFTATKTRATLSWRCWHRRWVSASSSSWRSSTSSTPLQRQRRSWA